MKLCLLNVFSSMVCVEGWLCVLVVVMVIVFGLILWFCLVFLNRLVNVDRVLVYRLFMIVFFLYGLGYCGCMVVVVYMFQVKGFFEILVEQVLDDVLGSGVVVLVLVISGLQGSGKLMLVVQVVVCVQVCGLNVVMLLIDDVYLICVQC